MREVTIILEVRFLAIFELSWFVNQNRILSCELFTPQYISWPFSIHEFNPDDLYVVLQIINYKIKKRWGKRQFQDVWPVCPICSARPGSSSEFYNMFSLLKSLSLNECMSGDLGSLTLQIQAAIVCDFCLVGTKTSHSA